MAVRRAGEPGRALAVFFAPIYLEHAFNLSDEDPVARWAENVVRQYFSGQDYYEPRLPCDATQVGRFRAAIGEGGVEELLKATLDTAVQTKALRPGTDQRRIVDLLSRAEGIVRMRREAERNAAELIPALFLDMLSDPATNPNGCRWCPLAKPSNSPTTGAAPRLPMMVQAFSSSAWGMSITADNSGSLDLSDLKYVELSDEEAGKYRLQAGDILFNRTIGSELVGKTGLWDGSRDAVAASYFIPVRVNRGSLNPLYLWAFMNSAHMKKVLFDTPEAPSARPTSTPASCVPSRCLCHLLGFKTVLRGAARMWRGLLHSNRQPPPRPKPPSMPCWHRRFPSGAPMTSTVVKKCI